MLNLFLHLCLKDLRSYYLFIYLFIHLSISLRLVCVLFVCVVSFSFVFSFFGGEGSVDFKNVFYALENGSSNDFFLNSRSFEKEKTQKDCVNVCDIIT